MKKIIVGVVAFIAFIGFFVSIVWMVSEEGEKGQLELFLGSMIVLLILLLISPWLEKKSKRLLPPTPTPKTQ